MLRGAVKTFPASTLENPLVLDGVPGDAAEIEAAFSGGGVFGLELRRSPDGKPSVVVSMQRGTLSVGNVSAYVGTADRYKLRIFLDKCCIEVYGNEGVVAVYNPIHAAQSDQGIAVFAQAQATGGFGGGGSGPGPAPPGATSAVAGAPSANATPAGAPGGRSGRGGPPPRLESLRVWPMQPAAFSLDRFHI
jgi:hypothetical protein